MDEHDARVPAPDSPPPELVMLDAWLRRDGERWRGRVASAEAVIQQARTLATMPSPPAAPEPPLHDVSPGTGAGGQPPRRRGRLPAVLAAIAAVLIVALMVAVVLGEMGARTQPGTSGNPTTTAAPAPTQMASPATSPAVTRAPIPTVTPSATATAAATATATPRPKPGPFTVTSVDMAVSPTSIAGMRCGTFVTVTYTATFHLAPNGPGGTIQFYYTVNNGRGDNPASVAVAAGQTTARYSFTWSGNLPADHTYPEPGGVMVRSPNAITSPTVWPSGACS